MPAEKATKLASANGFLPLGVVIRAWRTYREQSLSELARQAEMSKSYVSALENNRVARPNPQYVRRIAQALNIDYRDLKSGKLPPKYEMTKPIQLPIPELAYETLATGILNIFQEEGLSASEMQLAVEEMLTYARIVARMITSTRHRVQTAMQPEVKQTEI